MPSRQQKSAKKGSERYLMSGPNPISVTLRWRDGHSSGHENVCQWLIQIIIGSTEKQEIVCFLENVRNGI